MENRNQPKEMDMYTLGIWTVKRGNEDAFIRTWTAFAEWTSGNIKGSGKAYLLQDEKDPLRFISFGPWESKEIIQHWRDTDEFKAFVAEVTALCESFEPNTLRVVSNSP